MRGPMYLDKAFTERLLEQLEDAQALLAQMLTSRYIGPLREEAASWAEKLKEVGEVLEQWLEVQDLWQYLEAVFSNDATCKVSKVSLANTDRGAFKLLWVIESRLSITVISFYQLITCIFSFFANQTILMKEMKSILYSWCIRSCRRKPSVS